MIGKNFTHALTVSGKLKNVGMDVIAKLCLAKAKTGVLCKVLSDATVTYYRNVIRNGKITRIALIQIKYAPQKQEDANMNNTQKISIF